MRSNCARSVCSAVAGLLSALFVVEAQAQITAFRMDDLDLRDPHVYVSVIACFDVTDTSPVGPSVNGQLQTRIQTDADTPPDGLLDLSNLFYFAPLNQSLGSNAFDSGGADCLAPLATTACDGFASSGNPGAAVLSANATCLEPVADTTHGYMPQVIAATAPCFVSPSATVTLDLGGIPLPLQDVQIAATFNGVPAIGTSNGLMKGFLLESVANTTLIPADVPLVGGLPIAQVLPGGNPPGPGANCAPHDDRDEHNGQPGWWFYLNFTAPTVPLLIEPFDAGFGDGFEG
jgi:hypothetical protein